MYLSECLCFVNITIHVYLVLFIFFDSVYFDLYISNYLIVGVYLSECLCFVNITIHVYLVLFIFFDSAV